MDGSLGEFYLNNTYIDLSTDNPFWDSDTNRPNSVRKVIADTGVTPLIALPIVGNDAGNNLGTGGDFTVNSGPYVGARGGSEFWSRGKATNGNIANYLIKSGGLTGVANGKTYSAVLCGKLAAVSTAQKTLLSIQTASSSSNSFRFLIANSNVTAIGSNSSGSIICYKDFNGPPTGFEGSSFVLMFMADTAAGTLRCFVNGTEQTGNTGIMVNDVFNLSGINTYLGLENHNGTNRNAINGTQGMTYFTTDYIDFSQESNRNKFIDQLGYPKDLTQQIEDGDIPNPLIYMKFDNTAALGTNAGTGGNFTVNGTVTAGSDFYI